MRASLRLVLLALPAFAAACATDAGPATDTGQLVQVQDRMFVGCQDTTTFACGVRIAIEGNRITTVGFRNDGTVTVPLATGEINDAAHLGDLIASIPAEGGTVHDPGCGGAPLRVTALDIKFDNAGLQHFDVEFATQGPMVNLQRFVSELVTNVRTCEGTSVTFDSCTPNVQQQ